MKRLLRSLRWWLTPGMSPTPAMDPTTCGQCQHLNRYHGPSGACYHPLPLPNHPDCLCGHTTQENP